LIMRSSRPGGAETPKAQRRSAIEGEIARTRAKS
jgi:hypothetical protein